VLADGDLDGVGRAADHVQKKALRAAEQERPDVAERRAAWRLWQVGLDPRKLIFLDETWATTHLTRLRGRALRGQRVIGRVPHGHWKTTTLIAALDQQGIRCSMVLDGAVNRLAFEAFVEQVLLRTLKPGDLVVLDNLSSHKSVRSIEQVRSVQAELIYLPPYSPDLNPIELAFSKIKQTLRSLALRSIDALWGGMQNVLERVTPNNAAAFFRHCGYTQEIN
jgi:transposase